MVDESSIARTGHNDDEPSGFDALPFDERVALTELWIKQLDREATTNWFKLGCLLLKAETQHYWHHAGSFKEYIENLHLSFSYGFYTQLKHAVSLCLERGITKETAHTLKMTNVMTLQRVAREGRLTDELWEKALVLSTRHLRQELRAEQGEPGPWYVDCDGCGTSFPVTCPKCNTVKARYR